MSFAGCAWCRLTPCAIQLLRFDRDALATAGAEYTIHESSHHPYGNCGCTCLPRSGIDCDQWAYEHPQSPEPILAYMVNAAQGQKVAGGLAGGSAWGKRLPHAKRLSLHVQ